MTTPLYPKTPWRGTNSRFIRGATRFPGQQLVKSGKVQSDILDLAGSGPLDVLADYRALIDSPQNLILAEIDTLTLLAAHTSMASTPELERPRVVCSDAYELASGINHGTRQGYSKGPLGVISLDLTNNTGPAWWNEHGGRFFGRTVRPAIERYGVCCVILNHCLDHRGAGMAERVTSLEQHVACLCGALSPYNGGRPVRRSRFLPEASEVEALVLNCQSEGWLRKAQVYRSRVLRMITLRIYLRMNDHSVYSESTRG
jgi:hypothetical protein